MPDNSRLRPWFQFYASDFMAATLAWDDEQVGAYIRLLSYQWINGPVPIGNPKALARIAESAGQHLDLLAAKFPEGLNPRLESIRGEMVDRVEQGRRAAEVRWGRNPDALSDASAHASASPPAAAPALPEAHAHHMVSTPTPIPTSKARPTLKPNGEEKIGPKSGPKPVTKVMWDAFRATYPDRQGTQGWAKALDKANALVVGGVPWSEIMSGARRYADQQAAAGKVGSEFIKRAEFFLARDAKLWEESYPLKEHSKRTQQTAAAAEQFMRQTDDT